MDNPLIVIEAKKGWQGLNLEEAWESRGLIKALLLRDIKSRYRKTALGPIWFIISPFMNMVFSSFVFGSLAKLDSDGLPYPIFFYTAMLPWSLFRSSLTKVNGSLLENMPWLSKIYFPHLIAPITSLFSALIDWSMSLIVLLGLMLYYQVEIQVQILLLPLFLLIIFITALSIGLISAAFTIRFRDISRMVSFLLTAWYYVTPVIYSVNIIPENLLGLYKLNPMFWVVEGFRWSLLGTGTVPQVEMMYPVGFFSLLIVVALVVFSRASKSIVDIR